MPQRSARRRRKPNPPPTQATIWPQRFNLIARIGGRFAAGDRSGEIVRAAVRTTGRKLRDGWFDASTRPIMPRRIDPAAAVLIACDAIARLIGRPEASNTPDAPAWIETDRASAVPVLRIHARGATIQGERISRAMSGGRVVACDQTTGVQRLFSMDALREAAGVARAALSAAGIMLTSFGEVRSTRQGGVAVIGLRRVSTPELARAF